MPVSNSPLRYPGGKSFLSNYLTKVLSINGLKDGIYVEPYAGGAGAALNLLFGEYVQQIILNDADPCVFSFWNAILNYKDDFIQLLQDTPVTIEEWNHQRDIYRYHTLYSRIQVAFASFYLNRCNRSGIIVNAGPIGGYNQNGKWKIDARYNKNELIRRIEKIHLYRDRIEMHNLDAIEFLNNVICKKKELDNILVYLDPPYYVKGCELYLNHYLPEDHIYLAAFINKQNNFRWLLTYDDVEEIRLLYKDFNYISFQLDYTANFHKKGKEVLFYGKSLIMPNDRVSSA